MNLIESFKPDCCRFVECIVVIHAENPFFLMNWACRHIHIREHYLDDVVN